MADGGRCAESGWSLASFCRIQGVVVSVRLCPLRSRSWKHGGLLLADQCLQLCLLSGAFIVSSSSSLESAANTNMCLGANWKDLYTRFKCWHESCNAACKQKSPKKNGCMCNRNLLAQYWLFAKFLFVFKENYIIFPLEPQLYKRHITKCRHTCCCWCVLTCSRYPQLKHCFWLDHCEDTV